MKVYFTQEC